MEIVHEMEQAVGLCGAADFQARETFHCEGINPPVILSPYVILKGSPQCKYSEPYLTLERYLLYDPNIGGAIKWVN